MTKNATKSVRMVARISGTRNGEDWPAPGAVIELPEDEANALLISGAAVDPEAAETATLSGAVETPTTRGNQPLRQTAAQAKADADAQALAREQADAAQADDAREQLEKQAKESADAAAAEKKAADAAAKKAAAK